MCEGHEFYAQGSHQTRLFTCIISTNFQAIIKRQTSCSKSMPWKLPSCKPRMYNVFFKRIAREMTT